MDKIMARLSQDDKDPNETFESDINRLRKRTLLLIHPDKLQQQLRDEKLQVSEDKKLALLALAGEKTKEVMRLSAKALAMASSLKLTEGITREEVVRLFEDQQVPDIEDAAMDDILKELAKDFAEMKQERSEILESYTSVHKSYADMHQETSAMEQDDTEFNARLDRLAAGIKDLAGDSGGRDNPVRTDAHSAKN